MNICLLLAGSLSAAAAVMHLVCIVIGAPMYRFMGAGEQMATMADQGSIQPTLITLGITLVLSVWSLYAFSAAGLLFKLPFTRLALAVITLIYMLRGIAGFFLISSPMGRSSEFWLWSSTICLLFGIIHLIGLTKQWAQLYLLTHNNYQ